MINIEDLPKNAFFLDEHGEIAWLPIRYFSENVKDDVYEVGEIVKIGSSSELKSKKEIIGLFNDLNAQILIKLDERDVKDFNALHHIYMSFIKDIKDDEKGYYINNVVKYRIVKIDGDDVFVELVEESE